ncbi:uncharacterized protein EMH_0010690 [Eimeria mitis]|uniref:Uncharacterized protein n=1 Tax=Eimeria mitis TaxID=44415 RepID=U6K6W2_9EIME|nr:uncharacterized protein EMH_0010690 [Eimeria mitis]CDJ31922.1 hypothetical protein, conserved [Eimeria mitis]
MLPTGRGLERTPITAPAPEPVTMLPPEIATPRVNKLHRLAPSRAGRSNLKDHTEEPPEIRLLRMQEQFQQVMEFALHRIASTFDRSFSSSDRREGLFRSPPGYNRERPREWLMQINQYQNALQMDEEARLADMVSFLTGRALAHYCTTKRRAPELMPTTWEQLEGFIMQRFGTTPVVTTIRKLKEIEYNGNFEEVVERFSSVLAEGVKPPKETLKESFFSRLRYDMVKRVLKHEFASWLDTGEQMLAMRALVANRVATWYEYTTENFRQEVKGRDKLIREGWVLNSKQDKRQTHVKGWNSEQTMQETNEGGTEKQRGTHYQRDTKQAREREKGAQVQCYSCSGPTKSEQQRAERLVAHESLCCTEENTPHNAESKDSIRTKRDRTSKQEGQLRERVIQHEAVRMQIGLKDPQKSAEAENVKAFEGWHSAKPKGLPIRARSSDVEQQQAPKDEALSDSYSKGTQIMCSEYSNGAQNRGHWLGAEIDLVTQSLGNKFNRTQLGPRQQAEAEAEHAQSARGPDTQDVQFINCRQLKGPETEGELGLHALERWPETDGKVGLHALERWPLDHSKEIGGQTALINYGRGLERRIKRARFPIG